MQFFLLVATLIIYISFPNAFKSIIMKYFLKNNQILRNIAQSSFFSLFFFRWLLLLPLLLLPLGLLTKKNLNSLKRRPRHGQTNMLSSLRLLFDNWMFGYLFFSFCSFFLCLKYISLFDQ